MRYWVSDLSVMEAIPIGLLMFVLAIGCWCIAGFLWMLLLEGYIKPWRKEQKAKRH